MKCKVKLEEKEKIKYPVIKNNGLRVVVFLQDLLGYWIPGRKRGVPSVPMKKILLRNPAALGDVLYSLRLLKLIKKNYPDIQIGMLVGSWAYQMVKACKDVDYIYIEDHWSLNRGSRGRIRTIMSWLKKRRQALREIKEMKYDVAIDLYHYYPNAAFFLWQAGIPRRIGFDAAGGTSLYTECVYWQNLDKHNIEYQLSLLEKIGIRDYAMEDLGINFQFRQSDSLLLRRMNLESDIYIVVHLGTGDIRKEWPVEKWADLLYGFSNFQVKIVLTGYGQREAHLIQKVVELTRGQVGIVTLVNQLTIGELMQVIRNAGLFVGCDSFAGHIAALYGVKQVILMQGANNMYQWQPYGNSDCTVIRKKMSCSPCYFRKPCIYANACMDIDADLVLEAASRLVGK